MATSEHDHPVKIESEAVSPSEPQGLDGNTSQDLPNKLPDYRNLAQAHLDALAHAIVQSTLASNKDAPLTPTEGTENPPTIASFRAAAVKIEQISNHLGWLLPLQELARGYGLNAVELDALVWTFVQQSRPDGLPTLGEFFGVMFDTSAERNAAIALFRPEGRLRRWGLLRLVVGTDALPDNLYQRVLSLPEPVNAFLLGERSLGEMLGTVAKMVQVEADEDKARGVGQRRIELPHEEELRDLVKQFIDRLTSGAKEGRLEPKSLLIELCAPPRSGSTSTIRELSREYGALLIELDCTRLSIYPSQVQLQLIEEIAAVLRLYDAWLTIKRVEALDNMVPTIEALANLTDRVTTTFFVVSRSALPANHPIGIRALCHFKHEIPEVTRRVLWEKGLLQEQVSVPADEDIRMVAAKFDLNPGQIANAVQLVGLRTATEQESTAFSHLDASAFEQQRGNLDEVATIRRGRGQLDDLVLPENEKENIREIVRAATYRTQLLHGWGYKERFNYGTGVVALFSGEPGTGKTYAAEVIAGALGLDLYQIAAQQVVSKWVGETEEKIERIFEEARFSRALLLFDEADSLLGSRTEVKTASDRYANMATNQLLQAIEAYEGIVILTTNLESNLDPAVERRILFRIRFPFPGAPERAKLWSLMLPKGAPTSDDIDFEELGELFELSGGHIKNAIIRAGYDAIERGTSLNMESLLNAANREAAMTGRLVRGDVNFYR